MHARTPDTRPTTQHGRMTPDNATHAGYTTAATRTPQHAHDDTHAGHMITCPRPYRTAPPPPDMHTRTR